MANRLHVPLGLDRDSYHAGWNAALAAVGRMAEEEQVDEAATCLECGGETRPTLGGTICLGDCT